MVDGQYVTKEPTKDYPTYSVPFRVDSTRFVSISQEHAMCRDYPDADMIREYDLIDYSNNIVIPWKNGKPHAGFVFHNSKNDAFWYLVENQEKFGSLIKTHPELFI
jgi:hypothetical protein